ncbi:MAG: hypothetical protein LBR70_05690 [Lactobacillaceae bacterium]|jgi:hypothetical protein|nr:hypothetical protein [Lactobacillaceae bacterium]
MKKIVSKGLVEHINTSSHTRSTVTYNAALKMPMSSSSTTTEHNVTINGVKYKDVEKTVYPSLDELEEGMIVNVFKSGKEYIFGDQDASEEQVLRAYNKKATADNWGVIAAFVFFAVLIYPLFKVSEAILDMESSVLAVLLLFVAVGGMVVGSVLGGFYAGRLIADQKYPD